MGKSKKHLTHGERIRVMMEDAGIYEPRYEIQIEQTAETMVEIDDIKAQIRKEGRTLLEEKTGGIGVKQTMHPLYTPLNNFQQLLIRQLAALGLNKLNSKKEEAASTKKANDPTMEYLSSI